MIGLSSSPVDAPELGHTQGWPTSGESGHPEQSGLWVARPVTVSWGSGLEKLSCRLADGSCMFINPPPPPVIRQAGKFLLQDSDNGLNSDQDLGSSL